MIARGLNAFRRLTDKWGRDGATGVYRSLRMHVGDFSQRRYRELMWGARAALSRSVGARLLPAYIAGNGSWMLLDLRDKGISRDLFLWRAREPQAAELLKGLLTPGMTVLDIGANIGYYALLEARGVGSSGHIYAFEPVPETYDLLVRNVRMNGYSWVQCHRIALSSQPRPQMAMNVMDRSNLAHVASLGILDNAEWAFGEAVGRKGVIEVQATTIDRFLAETKSSAPIGLIRMDVEGYETEVIEGAYDTLRDARNKFLKLFMELHPRLYRNVHPNPIKAMLEELAESGFAPRYLLDARGILEGLHVRECIDLGGEKLPASHIFLEREW